MQDFPAPAEIREMRDWCRTHRGSITRIAATVIQKDGTVGINHSAVSRTIAGRERNSLVVAAYRQLRAAAKRQK